MDENGLLEDVGMKSDDFKFRPDIMGRLTFFFFFRKRQGPFTKFTSAVRRCQTTGKEDNSYNLLNTFCVSDTVGCPLPTNFCLSLITTHFTNEKNEG